VDLPAFIRAHTAVQSPALLPELRLRLAEDPVLLWEEAERHQSESDLPPPYWAFAWPGGQALARHLLDRRSLAARRSVLDIGAGSGLVGIAARLAGAAAVTASEIDPIACAAIAENARLNSVALAVAGDLVGTLGGWDLVLAGDAFYERPLAERLLPWLKALAAGGATVLIGDPGRTYRPRTGLRREASYSVPASLALEDAILKETIVWRVEG
jgi:predicted nicotinamide N-methyase